MLTYKFLKGLIGAAPLAVVASNDVFSTDHQALYTILATVLAGVFHAAANYLEKKYNIKQEK